jgi:hypothetical protein
MIRLSDSIGLAAFQVSGGTREAGAPTVGQHAPMALDDDLLEPAAAIGSDLSPAARGLSVAQHAANVLAHLCRDAP